MEQSKALPQISLRPRRRNERIPLTPGQLRFWKTTPSGRPGFRTRDCPATVRCLGRLDVGLLNVCIQTVIHRHESLRTRIVVDDGVPRQQVDSTLDCRLEIIGLLGVSASEKEQEVRNVADQICSEVIDLSSGPLFTVRLFRLAPDDHVVLCLLSHTLCDGASLAILVGEIWSLYRQGERGQKLSLPPLSVQFGDYAIWLQETYESWRRDHEGYWRKYLDGVQLLKLPYGNGMSYGKAEDGSSLRFSLGQVLSNGLREVASREGVKLPLVVCALYVAAMLRWCHTDKALLSMIFGRRYTPDLRTMIGFISGFLYLRTEIGENDTFTELLRRIVKEFYQSRVHDDFQRLPDLMPLYELGCTDLYFNWVPGTAADGVVPATLGLAADGELQLQPFKYRPSEALQFMPQFIEANADIEVYVYFVPDAFPMQAVRRFQRNLLLFAEQWVKDPDAVIGAYYL